MEQHDRTEHFSLSRFFFFFIRGKTLEKKKGTAGQTDVAASTLRGFTMSGFAPSLRQEIKKKKKEHEPLYISTGRKFSIVLPLKQ